MPYVRVVGIDDWVELEDPKTRKPYYFSKSLKKTQWERPTRSQAEIAAAAAAQAAPSAAPAAASAATSNAVQTSLPQQQKADSPVPVTNLKTLFSMAMVRELAALSKARGTEGKVLQFWELTHEEMTAVALACVKAVVFNPQETTTATGHTTVQWECWTSSLWVLGGGYKVRATEIEYDKWNPPRQVRWTSHDAYVNSYGVLENWNTPFQNPQGVFPSGSTAANGAAQTSSFPASSVLSPVPPTTQPPASSSAASLPVTTPTPTPAPVSAPAAAAAQSSSPVPPAPVAIPLSYAAVAASVPASAAAAAPTVPAPAVPTTAAPIAPAPAATVSAAPSPSVAAAAMPPLPANPADIPAELLPDVEHPMSDWCSVM